MALFVSSSSGGKQMMQWRLKWNKRQHTAGETTENKHWLEDLFSLKKEMWKNDTFLILTFLVARINIKKTTKWNLPITASICHIWFFTFCLSSHSAGPTRHNNLNTWEKCLEDQCSPHSPTFFLSLLISFCLSLPSVFLTKAFAFPPLFIFSASPMFFWFFYFL